MYVLALTGGIASGKSLVANRLRELGAVIVDADVLAREVVAPGTEGLARVREEFGDGVIAPDGSLDRAALGAIVFADPERRKALEAITHPLIGRAAEELIARAAPDAVVVRDIPLFVETAASRERYDLVVVVHAPEETRVRRMIEHRGMTREDALARIRSQATDEQRLAVADVVIENDGTVDDTLRQVDALWTRASKAARSEHPA